MNLMIFQLWEQSQMDNSRLRDDLAKTRDELSAAKKKLETAVQVRPINIKKCKGQRLITFLFCIVDSSAIWWPHRYREKRETSSRKEAL